MNRRRDETEIDPDRGEAGERRPAYALGVLELEFTIEPFVEGQPGPHVLAAVAAVEALGASVDFGPFGSTCRADAVTMPGVVAAIVAEAFGHGATHLSLHLTAEPT